MSTNAIIKIEGIDLVEVYKHWDGYPEETLPWLEEFNKEFTKERGDDPEYKFAQLLRSSVSLGGNLFTGWGVVKSGKWHYDFKYILNKDGSVDVEENKC